MGTSQDQRSGGIQNNQGEKLFTKRRIYGQMLQGREAFSEASTYFCLSDTLRGFSAELSS